MERERGEVKEEAKDDGDDDDDEDPMAAMMGFGGFGTTKVRLLLHQNETYSPQGKSIGQQEEGTVKVHKERTWRQYMNRRGGFNRPLEKMK